MTDLALMMSPLSGSGVIQAVNLFKSVVHLALDSNQISDLSPLDDMILDEGSPLLQSLSLSYNTIGEDDMKVFVTNSHRIKNLKHLMLRGNPFLTSESCVAEVKQSLWRNTSLERPRLDWESDDEMMTDIPLDLKLSGRGQLRGLQNQPLPATLWPSVLERANKIKYYCHEDRERGPTAESPRNDVVCSFQRRYK